MCLGSQCIELTGVCGFAGNHTWNYYECCSDEMCGENGTCQDNICTANTVDINWNATTNLNGTGIENSNTTANDTISLLITRMQNEMANGLAWVTITYQSLEPWSSWYTYSGLLVLVAIVAVVLVRKIFDGGNGEMEREEKAYVGELEKKARKPKKGSGRSKTTADAATTTFAFILIFTVFFYLCFINVVHAETYNHSLYSSSYAESTENMTTYKFKIPNTYNTTTLPFRLVLKSDFDWFDPIALDYALAPDGIDGDSPYWYIPQMLPNESIEVSFAVNRIVGLADSIEIETETVEMWTNECALAPYVADNESASIIKEFMESLNRSQNVTVYYEEREMNGSTKTVIAHLDGYNVFAVFKIGSNVSAVSDQTNISTIAANYINAISALENDTQNVSGLYLDLIDTRGLKSEAENECYMLTGMDRFPCIDRETCLYSCFSVPVCSQIGQSGWSFMDTIMSYNESVESANSVLDSAISSMEMFSKYPSYDNAQNALDDLIELNKAETVVIYHPMFTSYGFCPPAEYGIPQQIEIKRQILDYMEENCIYGEEERIVSESMQVARLLEPQSK
jgi:hypothetical protein